MQIVCASCDEPTPDDSIVCPRCSTQTVSDTSGATPRTQRAHLRAGKTAVVMTFILGIGFPSFAILVGLYGLYRLSHVSGSVPGAAAWRWVGIVAVVLLALFWGVLRRGLFAA